MTFTKKSANLTPIADAVFTVVAKAKEDKRINGEENVIDATIGTLCDNDGNLVALKSVFDHYDKIDHRIKASYAASFDGNPNFRKDVYEWVTQGTNLKLAHNVVATPGGSGAVSSTFTSVLDEGETVIIPNIAWGSYRLMATENNLKIAEYELFNDENHFNIDSIKETVHEVMKTQERILLLINDPCENPTGYTMSHEEWKEVIDFVNEVSKTHPVVLMDDIAYIDYAYHTDTSRKYMETWNKLSDNAVVVICFSCSKTMTSYGLRCGATVILAQQEESVTEMKTVLEKKARATWSNIPNAAMENFSWVVNENREEFLKEKQSYIDLMRERSSIFLTEANEVNLPHYPYREGFFVTLKIYDNDLCKKVHEAFIENYIYTVKVNHGIRVGLCSLPSHKIYGLAKKMKEIEDTILK